LGTPFTVYGSGAAPTSPPSPSPGANAGTQRYNYLVGRLRNRQITMEEATELFTLMQAMIARANDLARAASFRAPTIAPPPPSGAAPPPIRAAGPATSADDLLLVGILAMGAGAGLLAALSRRMGDSSPPAPSGSGRSTPSAASR
jgi:hypothetical protein